MAADLAERSEMYCVEPESSVRIETNKNEANGSYRKVKENGIKYTIYLEYNNNDKQQV